MTGPDAVPVAATSEVGSAALAAALEARDVAAIGQALRHDVVVVPILRQPGGETQNRVFEAPPGSARPYEVCLFSSAQTLAAYLTPEAPDREFALRRGTALVSFLEMHQGVIERVVFDPAGPHPMAATPRDVLLALAEQPGDDEVAWLVDGGPGSVVALPGSDGDRAMGLDVNLPPQWAVIVLDDVERRDEQMRKLVRDQTRVLGDRGARLRKDMRDWLTRTADQAVPAGGRMLAFLLQRSDDAALALSMVVYWHDLGPEIGGQSHLDRIGARLQAGLGEGDELLGSETVAGPFLRHSVLRNGAEELGAATMPLLVTDYWLQAPGGRGVVRLSFATPHVDAREAVTRLTDNVVFATAWVVEPGGE